MDKLKLLVLILVAGMLMATSGCSGSGLGKNSYALECNIDLESYGFKIDGEEGPVSIQTNGESTQSFYDPSGDMTSIAVEVNRTFTFEDSGNTYDIVGNIDVDFRTDTVRYDITASGDTFEEPQTCKN